MKASVMTLMFGKLHKALLAGGVPEQLATEAAIEVTEYLRPRAERRESRRAFLFAIGGMLVGAALFATPAVIAFLMKGHCP